ncbi:MAG: non-ribosomal peptide synthetase, partial [Candidatus Aminicenantes bacterium]
YKFEKGVSRFDLTLEAFESGEKLIFRLEYCTKLFKEETIEKFIGYFRRIISSLVQCPHQELWEIEITAEEEKRLILYTFNDTKTGYPENKTIHELFEEQVRRNPDNIAAAGSLQIKNRTYMTYMTDMTYISYRELNEKSNQLAHLLREKGVQPDTIVAIMVERSIEMVVGLLGILKAGGAYLPIDPGYPPERIRYMLGVSSAKVLLTGPGPETKVKVKAEVKERFIEIINLSNLLSSTTLTLTSTSFCQVSPTNLAYVIYTSGSTDNPKGVMIRHQNAVNFITGMTSRIDFSPGKTILALTTISFDIFFLETLLPITCGLKVVIADENQQKDPQLLEKVIIHHNVNMVQFTPSRLQLLLNPDADMTCLQGVEELIIGGEAFPVSLFKSIKERFQGKIYNAYGPTETTIWSTLKDLSGTRPEELTIGRPIANTRVYIVEMNRHIQIQPIGIPGELLIGGDGVASGYLNNPELTAQKFCLRRPGALFEKTAPGPHKNFLLKGTRGLAPLLYAPLLYRTGDLAKWQPDGDIEFLGRIDHQVKIRGFRIELEEIEEQLINHKDIQEAVVISKSNRSGDNYLCAYIVSTISPGPANTSNFAVTPKELNAAKLRDILSRQLPDYMIPSYFVQLEAIPLTPNGKVDRKALQRHQGLQLKSGTPYVTPETGKEKLVVRLWQEVLKQDKVGVHDNFFDLGGNSMNIIQLNSKLKKALGKDVPVVAMFRYPTIQSLLRYLNEEGSPETITDEEIDEYASVMDEAIELWDTLMEE